MLLGFFGQFLLLAAFALLLRFLLVRLFLLVFFAALIAFGRFLSLALAGVVGLCDLRSSRRLDGAYFGYLFPVIDDLNR